MTGARNGRKAVARPRKRKSGGTRERIIEVSLGLFAARGFEGTGMGDIAARAGIAKSVIYHHFASKEAVLGEISRRTIASAIDLKHRIAEGIGTALAGSRDLSSTVEELVSFVLSNREAMIVLLRESLRGRPDAPLFSFWEANLAAGEVIAKNLGIDPSDERLRDVLFEAFFMLVLPIVGFTVLGPSWAARFGQDPGRMREKFTKVFRLNLEELWFDRFFASRPAVASPPR